MGITHPPPSSQPLPILQTCWLIRRSKFRINLVSIVPSHFLYVVVCATVVGCLIPCRLFLVMCPAVSISWLILTSLRATGESTEPTQAASRRKEGQRPSLFSRSPITWEDLLLSILCNVSFRVKHITFLQAMGEFGWIACIHALFTIFNVCKNGRNLSIKIKSGLIFEGKSEQTQKGSINSNLIIFLCLYLMPSNTGLWVSRLSMCQLPDIFNLKPILEYEYLRSFKITF